jgi:hypothetical protein
MSEPEPGAAGPPWWALLPSADAQVSCGEDGTHRLRWDQGTLTALDHPDAEGELVFGALGGDRPACVGLIESWGRRADDLQVLAVAPRSAADELTVSADDPDGFGPAGRGWVAYAPLARSAPARWPGMPLVRPVALTPRMRLAAARQKAIFGGGGGRVVGRAGMGMMSGPVLARRARKRHLFAEADREAERRAELFSLLALGPPFQLRLSATVAAAWADGGSRAGDRDAARPALVAALAGRLAPAAQAWLGLDPGRADVSLHEDAGWGRLEPSGDRLVAALPPGWLASVWAAGLAVTAGHLVVAVTEATWPRATVMALPRPGADPVILKVRAVDGQWIRAEGAP